MKNKKGFTLVELLAVVVVLAIVGSIATIAAMHIKRSAADKTFETLEKEVADLGPSVYSHEIIMGRSISELKGSRISISTLCKNGYLDDCIKIENVEEIEEEEDIYGIKSPYNSNATCEGFLIIPKDDSDEYQAYLMCGDYNKSEEYDSKISDSQYNDYDLLED